MNDLVPLATRNDARVRRRSFQTENAGRNQQVGQKYNCYFPKIAILRPIPLCGEPDEDYCCNKDQRACQNRSARIRSEDEATLTV